MKKHYQKLFSQIVISAMVISQLSTVAASYTMGEKDKSRLDTLALEGDYVVNPLTREDILSVETSNEWTAPSLEYKGNDYSGDMLFDNNLETAWQTTGAALTIAKPEITTDAALTMNSPTMPVMLTLELREKKTIKRIELTPNLSADAGDFNGAVKDYEILMGSSLSSLKTVKVGTLETTEGVKTIEFDSPVDDVKVIRFIAKSGASDNLSLADMTIYSSERVKDNNQAGRTKLSNSAIVDVDATSIEGTHMPDKAIDNETGTYWKSQDGAVGAGLGTYFSFKLDKSYNIKELSLLPIQNQANNGGIKSYELYISDDKDNMGSPIKTGELPSTGGTNRPAQSIVLDQPVSGQYVKLHIKSGVGDTAAIADLGIFVDAKEESDTTLRYAAVDVKGITHEFELGFGQTRFEYQVPFVLEEGDIKLYVEANSKTALVSEPVKEGNTYRVTVTAEDGTEQEYHFTISELSQRGSEIEIVGVSGTGSHYGNDVPVHAKDGDFNTMWQAYTPQQGYSKPTLLLELDKPQPVQSLTLNFRQNHRNGGVTAYEVWAGNDKDDLTCYRVGTLDTPYETQKPPQTIELNISDDVKYVQFIPTAAHEIAAITEVFLYKPVPLGTNAEITVAEYSLDNGKTWKNIAMNPDVKDYEVTLDPFETGIPKIRVKTRNTQAQVNIKGIGETEGKVVVEVISQDGTVKSSYGFNFTRRPADKNVGLKTVLYNNESLPLVANKTEYDIVLPMGTTKVDVVAIPQSSRAHVTINGEEVEVIQASKMNKYVPIEIKEGKATAQIEVIAEDKETIGTYTLNFTVSENDEIAHYSQDFSNATSVNWKTMNSNDEDKVKGEVIDVEGDSKYHIASRALTTAKVPYMDLESPTIKNGTIAVEFTTGEQVPNPFGFILRGDSNQKIYTALAYENGIEGAKWFLQNSDGWSQPLFKMELEPDKTYKLEVAMEGTSLQVKIDGEEKYKGSPASAGGSGTFLDIRGQFGYLSWKSGGIGQADHDIIIDNIEIQEDALKEGMQPARPADAKDIPLTLGDMEVVVDSAFPRIMEYKLKGETAFIGQEKFVSAVELNGVNYYPAKVSYKEGKDQIDYTLAFNKTTESGDQIPFAEVDVTIALTQDGHSKDPKYAQNMKPQDRNIIEYKVTAIRELDDTEDIETIEFVGQNLITISGEGAGYGAIKATGDGINEVFGDMSDITPYQVKEEKVTYPLIYNSKYAAAIDNNVVTPSDKIVMVKDGIYDTISFSNGAFTYRYRDGVFSSNENTEALPSVRVIIGDAQNNDNKVDWQDAAILFREIMPIPKGSEDIKDQIWWIAMNFTSTTSNPFLRVLDNSKVLSHYYDGFGQMILNKGYQGEGHDDSHPDYAEVGIRQGGAKDFNILGEAGEAYNVKTGIHINATEYMLDAVNTKLENLQGGELGKLNHGWAWLDASYHVDQMKDLESGELERRLNDLAEAVPTLDFTYVDVYYRSDYHSKKFAELLNRNWTLATEFCGPFEGNQVFTHWGTDLYYPGSGLNSDIYRFLYNGYKDAFNPDDLLKGMQMPGVASWRGVTNMFEGVEIFYNQNLPTKYMQYSPIMSMTDDRVDFENGSYVVREGASVNLYSKDKNLIAKMTDDPTRCKSTLFIPWNPIQEDKIYYWNNDGGETSWTLPSSWNDVDEVYVYELTSTGRKFVEAVPVNDHKVVLNYPAQVPYIIEDNRSDTSDLPQDTDWGEGSLVKDPGFNSLQFGDGKGNWQKLSKASTTDHIEMIRMEETELYDNKLKVSGKEDALIAQEITGLEEGKTYTVSAWVDTDRLVELGMLMDEEVYAVDIKDSTIVNRLVDHKYSGKNYQRVRFDVTVPEGVSSALLYLHVPAVEEDAVAMIDDIRIFEQPGYTDRNKDDAIYFEDFENVDEGWGVFEYALNGGASKVHLARKDPKGRQIKSYAFDGEWSLKVSDNKTGEVIITYPSHVTFEPNTEYTVEFDYTLFAETKGQTLLADERYPYTFAAKDKDGNVLQEVTLTPSTLGKGENGGNANHDPSVMKASITFTTPEEEGTYLTVSTPKGMPNGAGGSTSTALNTLMIDNVAIYSEAHQGETPTLPDYPIFDEDEGDNEDGDEGGNGGEDGGDNEDGDSGDNGDGSSNHKPNKKPDEVKTVESATKPKHALDALVPGNPAVLQDITNHWAKDSIEAIVARGLMLGKTEKLFMPDEVLTRAEFATIISRIVGQVEGIPVDYKDVKEGWYKQAIHNVSSAQILQGYPDGTFKPEASISRAEMIVGLVRTMEYLGLYEAIDTNGVLENFKDADRIPVWAKDATTWAITHELIGGYPDGTLGLNQTVTRAETAKILESLLNQIN